jgi:hypothetical protein
MKKIIVLVLVIVVMCTGALVACGNRQMFDTVRTFDYAIVAFPDGTSKTIELKSWRDYDDGDQLQITAKDGTVYLVHAMNCVLVNED